MEPENHREGWFHFPRHSQERQASASSIPSHRRVPSPLSVLPFPPHTPHSSAQLCRVEGGWISVLLSQGVTGSYALGQNSNALLSG